MDKQTEWNITRYTDFIHSSKENILKHSSAKSVWLKQKHLYMSDRKEQKTECLNQELGDHNLNGSYQHNLNKSQINIYIVTVTNQQNLCMHLRYFEVKQIQY